MHRRWVVSRSYRAAIEAFAASRIALGISQRELARRVGKPVSFVNKIELIERRLDVVEFIVLAKAMDVPAADLIAVLIAAMPEDASL